MSPHAHELALSPEEFQRRLALVLASQDELEELGALIAWFSRRYPTARDRLRYMRRKYAEWTRKPILIEPISELPEPERT